MTTEERDELRELRRRVRVLARTRHLERAATWFVKETGSILWRCSSFVEVDRAALFPIAVMCRVLGLSPAAITLA